MKILVTGSKGFVGKNLVAELNSKDYEVLTFDRDDNLESLDAHCEVADFVVHLAGVNRTTNEQEFFDGNEGLTKTITNLLQKHDNKATVLISSSIQANKDNHYGKSKLAGELALHDHSLVNNSDFYNYRFTNLFGKWSRPNYNSVIATWCHNISRGLPLEMNDPSHEIEFTYIDDVVNEIVNAINGKPTLDEDGSCVVKPSYVVSLQEVYDLLHKFKDSRENLFVPNMTVGFETKLYSTYLSFLPEDQFSYPLKMNVDNRGSFTEFIKTDDRGQVSINVSKPGITKGEHWHHSKNEKFLVVSGRGVINLRNIFDEKIISYEVSGDDLIVVDIPTGYTHNIVNVGDTDMVTVMWVNEPFNADNPDTYFLKVSDNS